ncbi:MAG: PAS domain-containing protein [Nitrospira sp.]|nr:PAS domain-containing protein [Nitrospira sp.]MBH0185810.1 PAS domain-containing protein [Nitrospira sp.]
MGDPLDSAQDFSIELQQLRRSALELQRELPSQKSKDTGLAASLAHVTALSRTLHMGLLFEDAARRIIFANDTFCALFGVAGPDCLIGLKGRQAAELIQAVCVDPAHALSQIDRVVAGQLPVTGEEIRLTDGRWLERDYTPVIVDGVGMGHAWSYRDITGRKQIEESLRTSEELFRAFLDHAPSAMFMKTTDGRYSFTNQFFEQFCHSDRMQLIGKTDAALFPRDLADQYRANDRLVLETEQAHEFEETNGQQISIAIKFPVHHRAGQIYAIGGIVADITERKRGEALLYVQKQVLELVAASTPLLDTLDQLIGLIEAQADGMFGSILLLDEEGLHLHHSTAPRLQKEYTRAIDGLAIGPSVGSCGTAAFRREPVIVEDIATDPLWANHRHLAL